MSSRNGGKQAGPLFKPEELESADSVEDWVGGRGAAGR